MRFGLHSLSRWPFGWRARSQGLDSSGRPAEDPDGRHGPDGPKGGAAHDGFDGQTKQEGDSDSYVVAPSCVNPHRYFLAEMFRFESCLGEGRVLPLGGPPDKFIGASIVWILGMNLKTSEYHAKAHPSGNRSKRTAAKM